jgi:two-component system, chemotaxis family, sensor kinase CheA
MDDLLKEFLTETNESLERVDAELVRFEQEPNSREILGTIFRLVHTIKGTCGFLGLPRLENLAHAAESLIGKFRDGISVKTEAVTLVLRTIDRIKAILDGLETNEREPEGDDADLISELHRMASHADAEPQTALIDDPMLAPKAAIPDDQAPVVAVAADQSSAERPDDERGDRLAAHSIRVNVDTLDNLMTTVSELVLTRNQLLELVRRHEDSDFKVLL